MVVGMNNSSVNSVWGSERYLVSLLGGCVTPRCVPEDEVTLY